MFAVVKNTAEYNDLNLQTISSPGQETALCFKTVW